MLFHRSHGHRYAAILLMTILFAAVLVPAASQEATAVPTVTATAIAAPVDVRAGSVPTAVPTEVAIPVGGLQQLVRVPKTPPAVEAFQIIERFADGQPQHGIWNSGPDYDVNVTIEIWWNSYGQLLKSAETWNPPTWNSGGVQHIWSPLIPTGWFLESNYQDEREWLESDDNGVRLPGYLRTYIDGNGELVAYAGMSYSGYDVPSNKSPLQLPNWTQIGIDARSYKRMKGVTSQYMVDSANYGNITRWIYEQGPEYREKRDRELEERLAEARNESDSLRAKLAETERKLNETARESRSTARQVSFLSGVMEKVLGWIRTVFGLNLS